MQVKSIAECSKGSILQYFLTFIKLPFVIQIFGYKVMYNKTEQLQNPTMGVTINNESITIEPPP